MMPAPSPIRRIYCHLHIGSISSHGNHMLAHSFLAGNFHLTNFLEALPKTSHWNPTNYHHQSITLRIPLRMEGVKVALAILIFL
jgi:hypothetical protein